MPKTSKKQIIVGYVPVLHRGYLQLFKKFKNADSLYVIGSELIKAEDYLRKDLRALAPEEAASFIKNAKLFKDVQVLTPKMISGIDYASNHIVLPDEDISRAVGLKFKNAEVSYFPVFLRWDRGSVEGVDESDPDEIISTKDFDRTMIKKAIDVSMESSDIYRRVGAALLDNKNNLIGVSANHGEPTQHSPWMEGDPRNAFNRGVAIEMSLFTHAEAALIAEAAKAGTSLDGATLYVTTFPCPACSKLVAHSGIKKVYYKDGYAVLDGKRLMSEYGVSLVRVKVDSEPENPDSLVPYVQKS